MYGNYVPESGPMIQTMAAELGDVENLEKAERMLLAVFSALRNRWDLIESLEFLSLLPLPFKPFFVDGWRVQKTVTPFRHLDDFIAEVMKGDHEYAINDFLTRDQTVVALQRIFRVIATYINEEQMLEVESVLPDVLRKIWEESVLT